MQCKAGSLGNLRLRLRERETVRAPGFQLEEAHVSGRSASLDSLFLSRLRSRQGLRRVPLTFRSEGTVNARCPLSITTMSSEGAWQTTPPAFLEPARGRKLSASSHRNREDLAFRPGACDRVATSVELRVHIEELAKHHRTTEDADNSRLGAHFSSASVDLKIRELSGRARTSGRPSEDFDAYLQVVTSHLLALDRRHIAGCPHERQSNRLDARRSPRADVGLRAWPGPSRRARAARRSLLHRLRTNGSGHLHRTMVTSTAGSRHACR